MFTFHRHSLY